MIFLISTGIISVAKWKKSFSQSALPLFFYRDVNECRQNVCRPEQHCKNTRGGYKCVDLCPNGMTKVENGTCIGEWVTVSMTKSHLPSTSQVRHFFLKLMIRVNLIKPGNLLFPQIFNSMYGWTSKMVELWGHRVMALPGNGSSPWRLMTIVSPCHLHAWLT